MSRLTITIDRLVALLLALGLIVVGAGAAVWGTDRVAPLTGALDISQISDATEKSWWPWAVGIGGLFLVLISLRWLLSHLPRRGIGPFKLTGTGRAGRLVAEGGSVADAAAQALAATPGILSARGRVLTERGQLIAQIRATIDADADLASIAASADQVSAQLRHVLGRDDLHCQVQLRLANRSQPRTRVL